MKKSFSFLALLTLLSACGTPEKVEKPAPVSETPELIPLEEQYQADLFDATGGGAVGTAIATVSETSKKYSLMVAFEGLPPLEEGYFYEGWLVRTEGELSVLSTGIVDENMNIYFSDLDLSDHNQYILTLEPDDGDPAPAEHVLEGTFTPS